MVSLRQLQDVPPKNVILLVGPPGSGKTTTTGFLNGFFSAVDNQHVRETRCIAIGDPYCEWKFR